MAVIRVARKSRRRPPETDIIAEKHYQTAIYARLSGKGKTEETIDAQIEIVRAFLKDKPQFEVVEVFADDGWSGTSWERPSFQRMMEAVRNGEIDCIVVKDLSRFAREHIGAEDYLTNIFPFLGVRFIAVTDHYDNIKVEPQEYFLASFKNLAHAYFAQETSRKISMSLRVVQEKGLYIGSRAPFGYDLDPAVPHHLLVNEGQAAIVREIFERFVSGETYTQICDAMNRDHPGAGSWSNSRIGTLLKRELYIGTVVGHKTAQALYKGEKCHRIPKEEQIRVENAAPAIISRELWDKAQETFAARRMQRSENSRKDPFRGLVYCALCGHPLTSVYSRKRSDYDHNCKRCKSGVYCSGKRLIELMRGIYGLETITLETVSAKLEKIIVRDRKRITLIERGDV
jgi:DNA invertase Pin-like site-specific DNA recombinase